MLPFQPPTPPYFTLMRIIHLLFLLISSTSFAGEFNTIATLKVNTETGIMRYKSHSDIGINPFSGSSPIVKHSDNTKAEEVTIVFVNYSDTKKKITYVKLLDDLNNEGYRAATVQELCSVQSGAKEFSHKKLFCFGTQVYIEGLPDLNHSGIYSVSIVDNSNVELLTFSETIFEPGFVIAAVKLSK